MATAVQSAGANGRSAPAGPTDEQLQWVAAGVTGLAILVGTLFWRLSGSGDGAGGQHRDSELEYWAHRRRQIVASIAEMLKVPGPRPAKKVFHTIFDENEDVLVTEEPIAVPAQSARMSEMKTLLARNLSSELQEAIQGRDVGKVEELEQLGERVWRHVDRALCSTEMRQAASFLRSQGIVRRRQIGRLLSFCNREVLVWLSIGLFIKIISQIPSPVRMLYVSATVTAAARGEDGLADFHSAALMSLWLFAAEKLLQFAGRITMFRGEQLFTLRLKREVYAACLRQDMEFFDSHRCGELQNRLNSDTREVCQKVLYFPVRFIQFSFYLVFNLLTLLSTNPRLVSATLSVLPMSLFGNIFLMKRLQKYYDRLQRRTEVSASKTQEVLSNIRTVRAFAREPHELRRFEQDQEYEARVLSKVNLLQSMTQPLLGVISELSFFVGLYYGGLLISKGLLGAGEVITLVQGTQACTTVVTDLFETFPEIAKVGKPASRICELLERRPVVEPLETKEDLSESSALLANGGDGHVVEFDDVHFAYPTRREAQVLRGLNFTARRGEVLALVGVTGCGKSTIMSLLMRFYRPTRGHIRFQGTPLEDFDAQWLRRQIGVVAQEPMLFGTSIRENLHYGFTDKSTSSGNGFSNGHSIRSSDDSDVQSACILANAWEFIEHLPDGLSTEVGERGVQLSGGQKQRIAIARAILKQPKVLLLDEATSALDMESEKVVQRALDKVIRTSDCTTIVVAHRLATVQNAAQIVVIADGVAREQGAPHQLAQEPHGLYARLLQVQQEAFRPEHNGTTVHDFEATVPEKNGKV